MKGSDRTVLLLVEDDADARWAITALLDDEGVSVIEASNGREGLDRLRTLGHLPCLVLLDLMMPVMNGWQFLEEIRKDAKLSRVPVVVLSAVADVDEVKALGAREFLKKPYDVDKLLDLVGHYCLR